MDRRALTVECLARKPHRSLDSFKLQICFSNNLQRMHVSGIITRIRHSLKCGACTPGAPPLSASMRKSCRRNLIPVTAWMCERAPQISRESNICDTCREKLSKESHIPEPVCLEPDPPSPHSPTSSTRSEGYKFIS